MASFRNMLKDYFSQGKKPKEEHFYELIDSFYHKTEDGIFLSEEGNIGIGVEEPDARLHIDGGLKIGDAMENAAQVPQGTLRWTGAQLQISFNGVWQVVWKMATETHRTVPTTISLANKKVSGPVVSIGPLNFIAPPSPLKAVQLLRVSFVFDYDKSKSQLIPNAFSRSRTLLSNDRKLAISLQSSSGVLLLSKSVDLPEGTAVNHTYGPIEITGNKSIDDAPTFSLQFSISGKVGTHTVTLKQIAITCLTKA